MLRTLEETCKSKRKDKINKVMFVTDLENILLEGTACIIYCLVENLTYQ